MVKQKLETGAVGVIKELESGEGTPPELLKGKTPKQILEVCRELDVAVVDGSTELSKGFMGKPSMLVEMAILNEHDEACKTGDVGQLAFRPRVPFAINHQYFNNPELPYQLTKTYGFIRVMLLIKVKMGIIISLIAWGSYHPCERRIGFFLSSGRLH